MAKYDITYSCGHQDTVKLYGKSSEREWHIQRMETRLCPDCYKEAKDKEKLTAAARAKEENFASGYAVLTGTEAQIGWAETIRQAFIGGLEKLQAQCEENRVHEKMAIVLPVLAATVEWARNITSAKWWIDHREAEASGAHPVMMTYSMVLGGKRPQPTESDRIRHILPHSPHMTEQAAEALGLKDEWLAVRQAAAERDAETEYWETAKTLAAECRAMGITGDVKPWWKEKSDGKHFRLYFAESAGHISWLQGRLDETLTSSLPVTPELKALARKVWGWCNGHPSKKAMYTLKLK